MNYSSAWISARKWCTCFLQLLGNSVLMHIDRKKHFKILVEEKSIHGQKLQCLCVSFTNWEFTIQATKKSSKLLSLNFAAVSNARKDKGCETKIQGLKK